MGKSGDLSRKDAQLVLTMLLQEPKTIAEGAARRKLDIAVREFLDSSSMWPDLLFAAKEFQRLIALRPKPQRKRTQEQSKTNRGRAFSIGSE